MNLLQLKYFLIVEKHKSVSKAADELFITQPGLSKQISQLEKSLGFDLFDRKNSFELTKAGTIVKLYATKIFNELDKMNDSLTSLKLENISNINLNVNSASRTILKIISEYRKVHNNINFQLIQNDHSDNANITVFSTDKVLKGSETLILILSERIKVALPSTHHLATRSEISLNELDNEPFIFMVKESNLRNVIENFLYSKNFNPRIIFESNNPQVVQDMIECGSGLSFIPEFTWNLSKTNIKLIELKNEEMIRHIYLQIHDKSKLSEPEQSFLNFLREKFTELKNEKASEE